MLRANKLISAVTALILMRLVAAARVLSGLAALLCFRRPKSIFAAPPDDSTDEVSCASHPIKPSDETQTTPQDDTYAPPADAWREPARWPLTEAVLLQAKKEIADILPRWSIDIDAFDLFASRCQEFVLRAETPKEWGWRCLGSDKYVVEGQPKQVMGARFSVSHTCIHAMRDDSYLAQHIIGKLCGFAHDIRREVLPPSSEILPPLYH